MPVTIADIAREAGVSISTVSRVMNQTKPVSPELREKVYRIIEKNKFTPNALAKSMITKRTNIVGVVVPDISNAVFGEMTKGINSVCAREGYTIMVCESGGEAEKERNLLNILEDRQIDGVLFAGVKVDRELSNAMQKKKYPVVLVGQEASAGKQMLDTVVPDNLKAMFDAVTFLHGKGHKRIAYIGGPSYDYSSGRLRRCGYEEALKACGLTCPKSYAEEGEFSFSGGYEGMKRICEKNHILPTSVAAGSDLIALGAVQFLKSKGISVPEDISVIGFDDMDCAVYCSPALTTVRIPYFEEGKLAAEELLNFIRNGEGEAAIHYVSHKIIQRGTVKELSEEKQQG